MILINILLHHLRSEGFKRRLHAIYLPALKVGITYLYRLGHAYAERYVQRVERGVIFEETPVQPVADGAAASLPVPPPPVGTFMTYEEAYAILQKYFFNHEPQVFGQCAAHSAKNLHRFAMKAITGNAAQLSEADVYIDRETRQWGNDAGMYVDTMLTRVAGKGISLDSLVPTITTQEGLGYTREQYPDAKLQPFRIAVIASHETISCTYDAEKFYNTLANDYIARGVRLNQLSISSLGGWWSGDVAQAGGVDYKGGHSATVFNIPFMWGTERAVFVVDSSYLRGGVWRAGEGIRILPESAWRSYGREVRLIKYKPEIEELLAKKVKAPRIVSGAKIGETGPHVEAIQRALIQLRYSIPALSAGRTAFGNYGGQTQAAVKQFSLRNATLIAKYDSTMSVERLNQLAGKEVNAAMVAALNYLLG